jgi:serine O-acetyltransferase
MKRESIPQVSAELSDWSRERKSPLAWDPARSLLASIRAYQRHAAAKGLHHALARKMAVLRHAFWSVVTAAMIPLSCEIEGGLVLPHPVGVVIHPSVKIGPNCLIFQNVTIGTRESEDVPTIGGHVDIGAGAKILGAVTIGDHARIGANAVVLSDVPAGKTAVGVPAVIVDA